MRNAKHKRLATALVLDKATAWYEPNVSKHI